VIQSGNNQQVCFASEQDFVAYVAWLKDYTMEVVDLNIVCYKKKIIVYTFTVILS